ncbi:hypothetical protein SISSUDRAFT_1034034 [Sistotremastrum suecicum HHB10207 ss-3]|uniref:Uncharacterized protein n=1 Tax=Sistotremastrum suecicum HHB10207 ss-3 TaxID=1314776 RepID=A0A166CL42_9AGAM|nr:hypothetical protein SISSUDRAFT_1034034 [Sistotremastrum suecicum HHB10207 ss-3]
MSSRPSLSNVDNTSRDSRGPIIDAFEPSSSQTTDPFDTPLFHRLIGFVEQLHLTVQEQNVTAREQKILLEDVKKALVYQCNSIDARENPSSKANIGTPATQPPDSALTASPLPRQQKSTLAKQEPSTSTRPDNPDPEPRDITSANNSEAQIPARTPDDRRVENSIDASVPETPKECKGHSIGSRDEIESPDSRCAQRFVRSIGVHKEADHQ